MGLVAPQSLIASLFAVTGIVDFAFLSPSFQRKDKFQHILSSQFEEAGVSHVDTVQRPGWPQQHTAAKT